MLLKIPYIHCGSIGYRILLAIAVGAFTVFATSSYQLYNIYQHNNAAATVMCKANATVDLSLFPTQQLIVHINCNGTEFQEVYKCSSYSDFICAEIPTFDIPCKYDTQTNLYYNKKLSENDTMFFFMMSAFITIGSVFAMCMEWQSAYSWTTYEIRYLAILFNWQKNVD